MAEFDENWRRLAGAARSAGEPVEGLSAQRVRELARLARRPRVVPAHERRSLAALAALLACVLLALVPWQRQIAEMCASASKDLASLPARVPRPPHPPSGALALEALLDLSPFTTESPR
jgi:hypothetical protein